MPYHRASPSQVLLGLVDRSSGLQSSSSTLVFEFVPDAPAAAPVRPALLQELLQRLLGSLQHAQAAAAAAAAAADEEPAAATAAAGVVALLRREDEHGYSLEGYTGGLHKMLASYGWLADRQAGASELQAQHQELAALVTRERLSGALANRPTPERLHERNILPTPDAQQQAVARRKSLSNSLLNRPAPDSLQERDILTLTLTLTRTRTRTLTLTLTLNLTRTLTLTLILTLPRCRSATSCTARRRSGRRSRGASG